MENIYMRNSNKAIIFIFVSFLCATSVIWVYLFWGYPVPYRTYLWFFEFPVFSPAFLIIATCILFAGIFFGTIGRKNAIHALSKLQVGFAFISILINMIFLFLPILNLISMLTPRTITGVVDFKTETGGYICVTEINTDYSWSQRVNFNDEVEIYEQDSENQNKRKATIDAIQLSQVVEINYRDNNNILRWDNWEKGIDPLSITMLEGQYRPYENGNCVMESF
jgi:hypothetical protein